jgi:plasmid stabilization system protein ParE
VARKVKLLPKAEKELTALPAALQDQIISKLELLYDFPELGPVMFDAFQGYRALLAVRNTYRIVYQVVSEDLIEVAYIRHCSRQTRLRVVRGKR